MTGLSTKLIHEADFLSQVSDVVPPIHIATTYKYEHDPEKLIKASEVSSLGKANGSYYYSRLSHPNAELVEAIVGAITQAFVVAYSSGTSAFYAALTHYNPKVLAFGEVYHGNVGVANLYTRNNGLKQIKLDDDWNQLNKGDLVLIETPINPNGVNVNIQFYADKAHEKGAFLLVDSTFAPPPLQDPFEFGADLVLHSATKFFGGHSDLLAGLLITKSKDIHQKLLDDRKVLGTIIPSLESSLLVRSLKTLELRVLRQSQNATQIVKFLTDNKDRFPSLKEVQHGSLQKDDFIKNQLPKGNSPVFTICLTDEQKARLFPSKLNNFYHATSLGGVESLIEWRALSDTRVDPGLLRVSVGIENVEDLIEDLSQALERS